MGKFFWVNLAATNNKGRILMEEGTRFENESAIYTMGSNGDLSIFDKNKNTTKVGNIIKFTDDCQYNVFQAVMNNSDDGKNVKALSNKDIEMALEMYSQGKLTEDLSKELKAGNKIEEPKRYPFDKKISTYVTNGQEKFLLSFQYNVKEVKAAEADSRTEKTDSAAKNVPQVPQTGAFKGDNLFKNPLIAVKKSFSYKVQKGEDLVSIARKYEVNIYQLIAANPQLEEKEDYIIEYPENSLAVVKSRLSEGQDITIPARYRVIPGSCKNLQHVALITGVSEAFLKDFLTKIEVGNQDGEPDLTAYLDAGGTPTIGYGHTGKVNGKSLSCKKGEETKITKQQALELLAEDLLKHKAMTMAYLGEKNYRKAPKSVQCAILDVTYNKGIIDGYMTTRGYAESTCKIKDDLKRGDYVSALVHTKREKTGFRGLRKRNVYRFISGLTDLTPEERKSAMKAMKPYYLKVLNECKSYDKPSLKEAWENAEKGVTTGYDQNKKHWLDLFFEN